MAVVIKTSQEIYEVDTEFEAEELINELKKDFNITATSVTYKFKKTEQREYYVVKITKTFDVDSGE